VIDGRIDEEFNESHVTTTVDGLSRTACSSLNTNLDFQFYVN
jgi:hypothetical protein